MEEMLNQVGQIIRTRAQRRQVDGDDFDATRESFTKGFFDNGGFAIFVGGGNDAHVAMNRLVAAEALEPSFLPQTQKFRLRGKAHVADRIAKRRAAVGLLKFADLAFRCAGENLCWPAKPLTAILVSGFVVCFQIQSFPSNHAAACSSLRWGFQGDGFQDYTARPAHRLWSPPTAACRQNKRRGQ